YSFYRGETQNLLYQPIARMFKDAALLQSIASLVILLVLAFIVLQINNRYSFIRVRTMVPAPLYIIMISGLVELHTLHPVYFAAFFVLLAIHRFFSAFDQVKPYSAVFDAGLLLGIASLFYFNSIVLFPAFFFGIPILARETRWREFVVVTLGFLLPFSFAVSYAFVTDNLLEVLKIFEVNTLTPNNHLKNNIPLQIYLGFLIIITLLGSIKIIQQYDSKKVSTRKFFTVFFLLFITSLAGFTFVLATSQEMLVITAIPVTFLVSNFFVFLKSRFWGELLFSLLLIIVITLQVLA
ncbi:MAG: DUF6427 family protein, partial [Tangfeifania sp.]